MAKQKHASKNNPEFRDYKNVIAAAAEREYRKPSKKTVLMGIARRKVEALIAQRRLERELFL